MCIRSDREWPNFEIVVFRGRCEEFETLHPDLTFGDLIDHAKRVPEDTVLGRITNQVKQKDLVTIERTLA